MGSADCQCHTVALLFTTTAHSVSRHLSRPAHRLCLRMLVSWAMPSILQLGRYQPPSCRFFSILTLFVITSLAGYAPPQKKKVSCQPMALLVPGPVPCIDSRPTREFLGLLEQQSDAIGPGNGHPCLVRDNQQCQSESRCRNT
jgi:hypothetical protein